MGWAGEKGLEGVGRSGRGARRWQKEDPGAPYHPPTPFCACLFLCLPPPPFCLFSQTGEKEKTKKSARPEGETVWMGWGRQGRGWAAAPTP